MAAVRLLVSFLVFSVSFAIDDDDYLIEFKKKLKNSSALDSTWIKGTNPCDNKKLWLGVDCSETGHTSVSGLFLMNLGLSGDAGNIDIGSLANLQELRAFSLENNSFSGTMPEFNRLNKLKAIFLSGNQFSGEIAPDFFIKMGNIKKVELARNKFSGKIPVSLGKLDSLIALTLANNEFSGPVPELAQKSLQILDLSYNKLQGEIPPSMSRFKAAVFVGNPDLCGSIVSKQCKVEDSLTTSEPKQSGSSAKWIILGIVAALLLVTIIFRYRKKDDNFRVLGKENLDEEVQIHTPSSSNMRSLSSSRKGTSSGRSSRIHSHSGKSASDLVVINEEKGIFGLSDLMKASAEVLGNGGMGSAYKAVMANGLSVVVKRLREMNKFSKDEFDAEIRRLGSPRHPTFYHRNRSSDELNWATRLRIIKGIGEGLGFLHTEFAHQELPHGNLKSSNILLSSSYEPLLTDYGLHSLISNTQSVQALVAYKSPEALMYQQVSPKSDVYCLGIVILEIMTGKFPSQYNPKGGTDVVQWVNQAISEDRIRELIDPEIGSSSSSVDQMEKMLYIAAACSENDHSKRIEMREAVRNIGEVQA
ncbi:receptor-like protein kinase 3 [Dorcoceras hygrometricum]|uniref:Receptor-like protein kinase 3 n=1 Tax=Dorcoceras hygrometricum TaxID=472368 RepID=A0A2Z7A828_9LAMI|nr:receptor-like protein kinase 3 [Dorcoceras hygrometricum]